MHQLESRSLVFLIAISVSLSVASDGRASVLSQVGYPETIEADTSESVGNLDGDSYQYSFGNNLDVTMVDGEISIRAVGVSLGRLLQELDSVAGTQSSVPGELDGYRASVWLERVPLSQVVEKIFEGLPLDFAVVGDSRIVVLARSQPVVRSRPESKPNLVTEIAEGQVLGFTSESNRSASSSPSEPVVFPTPDILESSFPPSTDIDSFTSTGRSLPEFVAGQAPFPFFVPVTSETGPAPVQTPPDLFGNSFSSQLETAGR